MCGHGLSGPGWSGTTVARNGDRLTGGQAAFDDLQRAVDDRVSLMLGERAQRPIDEQQREPVNS